MGTSVADNATGIYLLKINNKTLEQGVKYVQSCPCSNFSIFNFEHVIAGW